MQFSKSGIRYPYSNGNFKGVRKSTVCEYGQVCGGTENLFYIRKWNNKRIRKSMTKIKWKSHNFKAIFPLIYFGGIK